MINSKKYSKCIYLALAVLFVYNSFGYLVLYFPVKTIIKHVVQKSIQEKKIDPEELSLIIFNVNDLTQNKYDFTWVKPEKEFRYNGKMYDIEDVKLNGDSVYYTCYYDHKENILEAIFTLQFNDLKKDKTQNSSQRIILMGIYSEEIKDINKTFVNLTTSNIPLQKTEAGLLSNISDVPTPPPRIIV